MRAWKGRFKDNRRGRATGAAKFSWFCLRAKLFSFVSSDGEVGYVRRIKQRDSIRVRIWNKAGMQDCRNLQQPWNRSVPLTPCPHRVVVSTTKNRRQLIVVDQNTTVSPICWQLFVVDRWKTTVSPIWRLSGTSSNKFGNCPDKNVYPYISIYQYLIPTVPLWLRSVQKRHVSASRSEHIRMYHVPD